MSRKLLIFSLSIVLGLFMVLSPSLSALGGTNAQTRLPNVQNNQDVQNNQANNSPNRPEQTRQTRPMGQAGQAGQTNRIDITFLSEAAQAGLGYTQLSQLALEKSENSQIQEFARSEIEEQRQNAADFQRIASELGVRLPTSVPTKYQVAASSLSQLSGQAFDSAFLDEGGVNSHLEAASVFQREAAFGNNPDLLAVANRGLNIIGQHFALASQLTDYRFAQVPRRYTGQTALEGSGTPNQ